MNALKHLCGLLGIRESDPYTEAAAVAQAVLDDLYLPDYVPMKLQQKLAYGPRLEKWRELGILPGGAKSEVCAGVVKCSTNLNSDPVDMLLHCLKLGISTGVYGLMPVSYTHLDVYKRQAYSWGACLKQMHCSRGMQAAAMVTAPNRNGMDFSAGNWRITGLPLGRVTAS